MGKNGKNRGDFFGVDLDTFHRVCALKDVDLAACYLVVAAGTGADNRITSWSREAIKNRTSLTWRRARDLIDVLIDKGFARWQRNGARPRLELIYGRTDEGLSPALLQVIELVRSGGVPKSKSEIASAARAKNLGHLAEERGVWSIPPTHHLVWIPKSFVEWNGDHRPPVERVRRGRDALAFQLLVDLYNDQDLAERGGVSDCYYKQFDRSEAAATGAYKVWSFDGGSDWVRWVPFLKVHYRAPTAEEKAEGKTAGSDFFGRMELLRDAGVLEWVYYLTEDESEGAPLIHPVAVVRNGKVDWNAPETIIGAFAQRAALALAGYDDEGTAKSHETQMQWAMMLPAERVLRKVQLRAISRLRYRARTSNAARWQATVQEEFPLYVDGYRAIIAENAPNLLPGAEALLADFNGASILDQHMVQRDVNDNTESPKHGFAA